MAAPLADRMRPETLEDIVGQKHLLAPGKALRNIIESGRIPNLIFYGPSGVGKTTLASIIARRTDMRLHKLNGTTASTADIKAVVEEVDTLAGVGGILLYLDEIQYFNKKQQQTLLEHIENGNITLIASTTENPYFYVYGAILSRSTVSSSKRWNGRRWNGQWSGLSGFWRRSREAPSRRSRRWRPTSLPPAAATCARRSMRWSCACWPRRRMRSPSVR